MDEVFERYPEVDKVYVTSDGCKFFKEHYAQSHARSLEDKDVEVLNRTETSNEADEGDNPDLEARIALIQAMATIEEVQNALVGESNEMVLNAGQERIAALTENQE